MSFNLVSNIKSIKEISMHVTAGSNFYKNNVHIPAKSKVEKVPLYEDAVKSFFKPYPQEALNGAEGLTGTDIAKILGVKSTHVLQKARSKKTAEMLKYAKLKKAEISAFNDNGVLYEDCVFETRAAEIFIGKYENTVGWMYIRYLQACREAVTVLADEYEQLRSAYNSQTEQLQTANAKVEALTKPKKRKSGNKEVSIITNIVEKRDMFGDVYFYKEAIGRGASTSASR